MKRKQFVNTFSELGDTLNKWLKGEIWLPVMDEALVLSEKNNPLFTNYFQRYAIETLCDTFLKKDVLDNWLDNYEKNRREDGTFGLNNKKIFVVMAGNIPLVGFHDFIVAVAAGVRMVIKLSSKDAFLLPAMVNVLKNIAKEKLPEIEITADLAEVRRVDALIMMGSDKNVEVYDELFPDMPKLMRKSRVSVAILGDEVDNMDMLAKDISIYFGLGCRSVSHLFVKNEEILERIAKYIDPTILYINPINNVYKRNKATLLINNVKFVDSKPFVFVETDQLSSPFGVIGYSKYSTEDEVREFLSDKMFSIQKIYTNFGEAQKPEIVDYPDSIDTFNFLLSLNDL